MVLTREFFANYKYLNSMIKSIERRLRYFENHPLSSSHGVVKGSMRVFPYVECHFAVSGANVKSSEERYEKIRQLSIDLKNNKQLYEDMKLDIEQFIFDNSELTLEEQTIFRLKFIDEWSCEKIGRELGYDKSVISRKIDNALNRIDTIPVSGEISSTIH